MLAAGPSARCIRIALWICGLAGGVAMLGIAGHVLELERLDGFIQGRPRITLTTALSIMLAAVGIGLQCSGKASLAPRASGLLISLALVAVAGAVMAEHLLGTSWGFDWPRVRPQLHPRYEGRPSAQTALGLGLLGATLATFDVKIGRVLLREWLCLVGLFVAFVSLVGHAFGAGVLYELGGSSPVGVALPSALAIGMLSVASLLARPHEGFMRLVTSAGPGGILLRRLGLIGIVGGTCLGGLVLALVEATGLTDLALALAIANVVGVFLALLLLVATAAPIDRAHDAAQAGSARVQELFDQAPEGIFIADLSGRYTEVNDAGCRLLGYSRAELLGKTIIDLLPEEDIPRLWTSRHQLLDGAVAVDEWRLRRKDGTFVTVEATAKILADGRWQGFVRDRSERLELERKVVESRDFLEKVLESSTEYGIIAEDLSGRIVLWNEGARLTYGYGLEELLGKNSDALIDPTDQAAWSALHARAIADGSAEGTILARRKSGAAFPAKVVCTRRVGADKRVEGVLVVSRDQTEEQRRLVEQEFLARVGIELASCLERREVVERVAQLVTDFLGDLAAVDAVSDGDLRRVRVRHGEHDESAVARAVREIGAVHGPGHPLATVIATERPLLLSQITASDRARYATSPEHARVLEQVNATSAMLVPLIARGQLMGVLSISATHGSRTYGTSDLRLAEELARRAALTLDNVTLFQQSRLQAAITANLAEGVALLRADDLSIVYANRRFAELFGYEVAELEGTPVSMLYAAGELSSKQRVEVTVAEVEHAGTWHGEIENVRKDGRRFWSAVSISRFDHEEHGKVWIAVHSDITARKQLEARNAQALRDKEVLLREIHHRVKNNLQVISSLFSLQRDRTDNAELRSLLNESQTRVQSIALVHEHLYLSADLAAIDLDRYLRSLVDAIRSSYGAERVVIETSASGVLLDIEQAVPCALLACELVSNSIKHAFSGKAGAIRVRVQRDDQGFCVLEVEDNGRGIPEDFDWKNARSLGLRLVQALLRQLRGEIQLDRTAGTHFRARFPLREAQASTVREQVLAN